MKKIMKRVLVLALVVMTIFTLAAPASAAAGTYDKLYYNVSLLNSTEQKKLSGLGAGTVIVMYPSKGKYYTGSTAENLVIDGTVKIVCMPGTGSSSVAAAAMARQIAKAKNKPVAAIVTGYGTMSVMYESMQCYFVGRTQNVAKSTFTDTASSKLVTLYKKGARPSMLVGHSKGNFDIANALFMMNKAGNKSWYNGVTFKTFGAGVNVPAGVTLKQYIGALDTLGLFNTVSTKNLTYVAGRYHTLNGTTYPWTYMPIEKYV